MVSRLVVLALVAVLAAAPGARACGNGAVLFADHFQRAEPYSLSSGPHVRIAHGVLEIEPPQFANWYVYYAGVPYRRLDVCVTLSIAAFHAAGDMGAGILFWVNDRDHNDVFMIRPVGHWVLAAHVGKQWQVVATDASDAIRHGAGAVNELDTSKNLWANR